MAEINYLQLHKDKKDEIRDLNRRRDTDNELVTTRNYVLKDAADRKIDDVLHVTMNRLNIFKAYVEASLNKADEKVKVESENANIDTSVIEEFIMSYYRQANRRLMVRGDWLLEPFMDQQSCMRGEAAILVVTQMLTGAEGPFYDANITNWDTRYMTYDRAPEGLAWGGYEIEMTRGTIEGQPWAREIGFVSPSDKADVIDLWTPKENIIYVKEEVAFRQKNPFGYVPICVQRVPIGSMLADKDSLKYQAESIFFLVRGLIDQYNMCISILQTLNLKAIKAALQQPLKPGQEPSDYSDVASMGSNTATFEGQISLIPYGDARNSMIIALQEINKALDDGTLSRIALGELPGELSAVALVQIEKGQGQVFMPRLGNRGLLKQQGAEMAIRQTIALGQGSVEVGTPGHKRTVKVKDLEGDYEIKFVYANKDPDTEFARVRMAKEYQDVLPELTILEDILKRDDPQGDFRGLSIQRAIASSPVLQKYERLIALREAEDLGDEKAAEMGDLLEMELNITIEQLQSGQLPREEEQPEQPELGNPRNSNTAAMDLTRSVNEPVGGV